MCIYAHVYTCIHTHISIYTECTSKVNPNITYGLQVIMMCQCRFISLTNVILWCRMQTAAESGH